MFPSSKEIPFCIPPSWYRRRDRGLSVERRQQQSDTKRRQGVAETPENIHLLTPDPDSLDLLSPDLQGAPDLDLLTPPDHVHLAAGRTGTVTVARSSGNSGGHPGGHPSVLVRTCSEGAINAIKLNKSVTLQSKSSLRTRSQEFLLLITKSFEKNVSRFLSPQGFFKRRTPPSVEPKLIRGMYRNLTHHINIISIQDGVFLAQVDMDVLKLRDSHVVIRNGMILVENEDSMEIHGYLEPPIFVDGFTLCCEQDIRRKSLFYIRGNVKGVNREESDCVSDPTPCSSHSF